jgi:putative ABC transport system substrate-binding protein
MKCKTGHLHAGLRGSVGADDARRSTRRKLLIVLGAGAFSVPLASFAQQQGKVWRIGFLSPRTRPVSIDSDYYSAFPRGMRDLGYVEGKNLVIEWRFADGQYERLPGLAAELVRLKVDVIVAAGPPVIIAAQKATTTIPIVIVTSIDPVDAGFVKSLARPGGNITGSSNLSGEVSPKHLEMLLTMAPKLSRVALLVNPANSAHATMLKIVQAAAQKASVKVLPVVARTPQEIETAFSAMTKENAGAIIVGLDPFFVQQRRQIAELAAKNRFPSIATFREYVEDGGLISYGQNLADQYRHVAVLVDKILKGAKPGDLPVEQSTRFDMVINRNTAKALGIKIPNSILLLADKVIE